MGRNEIIQANHLIELVNWHPTNCWLLEASGSSIEEELEKLQLELNRPCSYYVGMT